jgi:hypothetical protein
MVWKRERAEGMRVSLGWGCYYKLEELKNQMIVLFRFTFSTVFFEFYSVNTVKRTEAYHRGRIYAIAEGSTISCICHMVQWLQVKRFSDLPFDTVTDTSDFCLYVV